MVLFFPKPDLQDSDSIVASPQLPPVIHYRNILFSVPMTLAFAAVQVLGFHCRDHSDGSIKLKLGVSPFHGKETLCPLWEIKLVSCFMRKSCTLLGERIFCYHLHLKYKHDQKKYTLMSVYIDKRQITMASKCQLS